MMREAVEKLVREIVENGDAVEVMERTERSATIVSIRVAETDMGKIIGREGRTVKALRSLLNAASQKTGHRYLLEIVE